MLDLSYRTKAFALRILRLYSALPKSAIPQLIGKQAIRSGTSVGAHYREAFRARTNPEFISKIEVGLQELEETRYWLELLIESETISEKKLNAVLKETDELISILVSCVKNVKAKKSTKKPRPAK
jgi:four helix bundle protein